MGTQPNPAPNLVFGPFEYDGLSGALIKYGTPIRLHGKPLQILSLLLSRPGQILSRDELQRHLWEGTTFVDFEQGLNSAVNKLRQTLGDSADQPRYVETLPGRGYRFIAPIQRVSTNAVLEMAAPASLRIEPKPSPKAQPWMPLIAGVALVVAAGGGYWLAKRPSEPASALKPTRFAVLPPAGFALEGAASRQSFALSPDGTRLAVAGSLQLSAQAPDTCSTRQPLIPRSLGPSIP